jgi:hypothetical protein
MTFRTITPLLLSASLLAACSGGGGSGSMPSGAGQTQPQSGARATGTLTLINNSVTASSNSRHLDFISSGFAHAAAFVDTTTAPVGQSTSGCTQGSCTFPFTTTAGTHTFEAEIDNASAKVLSEGKTTGVTIVGGPGNSVTITMNGASNNFNWQSDTASTTASLTTKYAVADESIVPITTAGSSSAFDNGAIAFAVVPTGGLTGATFTPATLAAPDALGNDYAFTATCPATTTGTFTVTATATSGTSTTVSTAQLGGASTTPTYPGAALTVLAHTYTCNPAGVISDSSGTATLQ